MLINKVNKKDYNQNNNSKYKINNQNLFTSRRNFSMNRYEIIEQIGHGAYSIVYKALDVITNTIVAIKSINNKNPDIHLVLNRQIRTLQTLQHPNIIKLLGIYNDHSNTNLVFQYLPFDLITYYKDVRKNKHRNLNDQEITFIMHQMCQALACMHQRGIMHRDIKPQNVLIDPLTLRIKLIDFGFATPINHYAEHTQYMITRWYRPLQIVLNLPYDAKADIFALGALLLELYQGEEIFRSSSNIDQLYWILQICGYPTGWTQSMLRMTQLGVFFHSKKVPQIYKMTQKLRPQAESLIIGMLQTCPHSRLTITDVLSHKYFSQYSKQQLNHNGHINDEHYRSTVSRYRTNSINMDEEYKKYKEVLKSNEKYEKRLVEERKDNGVRKNNENNNNNKLHLNINNIEVKKQNENILCSQRSIYDKNNDINLYSRRLSQNIKQIKQHKYKKLNRNNSYINNINYKINDKINNDKSRYRTEGNQKLYDKKYYNYNNIGNKQLINSGQKNNFVDKYVGSDYNNQEEQKILKNKIKPYQGLTIISLKSIESKNDNQLIRQNKQSNYHFNNNIQQIIQKKKLPTFTKIRDKFAIINKNDKIKISLTQRNQFNGDRKIYNINYR